jgi:hypothetical protein
MDARIIHQRPRSLIIAFFVLLNCADPPGGITPLLQNGYWHLAIVDVVEGLTKFKERNLCETFAEKVIFGEVDVRSG